MIMIIIFLANVNSIFQAEIVMNWCNLQAIKILN